MRFTLFTLPALAAVVVAQDPAFLSSIIAGQSSIIGDIATASDPAQLVSSYVSHLTSTLNPSQISAFNSASSRIGADPGLSSLATQTGSAALASGVSSLIANPTSASTGSIASVSGARSTGASGSSASGNAAPTNFVAGGLISAAGVVGAAAMLL